MTMVNGVAADVRQGGVGSNWRMTLQRKDLPSYTGRYDTRTTVVTVSGSRSGRHYRGGCTWSVDVLIPVPPDRNRQPKPHTGTYYSGDKAGQSYSDRIEYVTREISTHDNRQQAVDAAYKLISEINIDALLDKIIEEMWAKEYAKDSNNYLQLQTDDQAKREARIEKIRAVRKADPEFAELFPEPPNKANY